MHPVERAAAMFEYLKTSIGEQPENVNLSSMTLLDYARDRIGETNANGSKRLPSLKESNFLVRSLAQVPLNVPLHGGHVAHAERVLKRYTLLGLMEDEEMMMTSWKRIQKLYGWDWDETCIKTYLPKLRERKIPEESEEYKLLAALNEYDMMFFEGINTVFDEQGRLSVFQNLQ